jgi:hypothetical protein
MRVKIGDTWHSAAPGAPIAVELTPKDRENIAAMRPDATRYGIFDESAADSDRMRSWLGN